MLDSRTFTFIFKVMSDRGMYDMEVKETGHSYAQAKHIATKVSAPRKATYYLGDSAVVGSVVRSKQKIQ